MNEQIIQLHPLRTVAIVSHQKSKHIHPFLPAVRGIKVKGYIVNWMLMWTNINHQFIVRLSSEVGREVVQDGARRGEKTNFHWRECKVLQSS